MECNRDNDPPLRRPEPTSLAATELELSKPTLHPPVPKSPPTPTTPTNTDMVCRDNTDGGGSGGVLYACPDKQKDNPKSGRIESKKNCVVIGTRTRTRSPTRTRNTISGNNGNADDGILASPAQTQAHKRRLTQGCSSLMYACQQGHLETVVQELRTKPNKVYQRDRSNKSVLHYCTGQRDLVAAASVAIAAPELLESADEDGFTPLHLAVIQGNLAMVNLLLANKADVNAVDNEGHSVVHWATVCGEIEALRSVLQAGANVATPDINGGSPLHYAAQMCGASYEGKLGQASSTKLALDILAILVGHPHSSIDVIDKDGRQPLLWAASAGSAKAMMALVKAGARVESADKDGLTALHCAASRGHTECIDTLISLCGAPTDLIDSNGCTALHYAVTLGHADATSRLLDLDADPNRQDRKGRTPAHCGCSKGQFETVKLLKERGANLWLRNAKGDLPVHEAASSGRRELVEWLLDQRSKQVNTTSNDGRSLLHIAAGNDYTDMCKMLLDFGADINCIYRNPKGVVFTPLDCSLQRGFRSTAKFLQSNGGLPAGKLRLSSRRPNAFNDQELVKPMKFIEKEEVHDLQSSKKYVVYLKRSDSESAADCSCTEAATSKKQRRHAHMCRHHRKKFRRRTSSCGAADGAGKDGSCSDICRSKSNIEIRRRRKSKERSVSSDEEEEEEDSCENCCRHKKKQRLKRRERSLRKSREVVDDSEVDCAPEEKKTEPKDAVPQPEEAKPKGPSRPQSAKRRQPKESTFIKTPPADKQPQLDLTDDDELPMSEQVVTQVDVHKVDEASIDEATSPVPVVGNDEPKETSCTPTPKICDAAKTIATPTETLAEAKSNDDKGEVQEESKAVEPMMAEPKSEESKQTESKTVESPAALVLPNEVPAIESEIQKEDIKSNTELPIKTSTELPIPVELVTPTEVAPTHPATEQSKPDLKMKPEEPTKMAPVVVEPIPLTPQPTEEAKEKTAVSPIPSDVPATKDTVPEGDTETVKIDDLGEDLDESLKVADKANGEEPPEKEQEAKSTEPEPTTAEGCCATQSSQPQPTNREQETRRSFTLLPDSPEEENKALRKSSFQVLKSDDSVDVDEAIAELETGEPAKTFQIVPNGDKPKCATDGEYSSEGGEADDSTPMGNVMAAASYDYGNGRKRRLKKRVKSGSKARAGAPWQSGEGSGGGGTGKPHHHQGSKDQDSGFEPSPRAVRTKIPSPRNIYTAYIPRKPIYATLDGRSCSSRQEHRKPGDRNACDMSAVTRSIQRNIRRYYMEKKIFQHLLELKSLQIRSSKLNESVLVKRAVDDYHKSCIALGSETGGKLRRYPYSEYTFKNFELFLYDTLKTLQKPGTFNFQNINDVYDEAERRLSPDYNAYEKALQCTTKTHRCLHAAHAYTGIPCAAYIPMMNHHTMPKFGFGPYKKTGVGSFYLPKILTSQTKAGSKVSLELSHGKSKQLISLPSEKLDSNKRYYVTFTVKESGNGKSSNQDAMSGTSPSIDIDGKPSIKSDAERK